MSVCHMWQLVLSFYHMVPRSSNLVAYSTEFWRDVCNYLQVFYLEAKTSSFKILSFWLHFKFFSSQQCLSIENYCSPRMSKSLTLGQVLQEWDPHIYIMLKPFLQFYCVIKVEMHSLQELSACYIQFVFLEKKAFLKGWLKIVHI